ncbi:MAG: hypothetical protein CYPHOPRED_000221 [Cyphobasidiales sp. Tagirdzhanova-0007]|nr:MAG: hypothetical protein CYPHOPRED_000221 [Cyphobasidiales sp. Tagirdzhanova-0007]
MLNSTVAYGALRIARSTSRTGMKASTAGLRSRSSTGGRKYASSSTSGQSNKGSKGADSMLMGAGLLGATVLVGYAMGKIGGRQSSTIKNEEAGGRSYAASSGEARETSNEQTSERESQSRTLSKSTPASVIRKSDEAAQSMPNSGSSSSSGSIPPMASEGESIVAPANVTVSEAGSSSSGATSLSSEGETEDEDASQAAFNPETGEINWDCPKNRRARTASTGSGGCRIASEHIRMYTEKAKVAGNDDYDDEDDETSSTGSESDSGYDIVSAVESALLGEGNDTQKR